MLLKGSTFTAPSHEVDFSGGIVIAMTASFRSSTASGDTMEEDLRMSSCGPGRSASSSAARSLGQPSQEELRFRRQSLHRLDFPNGISRCGPGPSPSSSAGTLDDSEPSKVPVELRNLDGTLLAHIVVDPDASMGQFIAKLREQGLEARLLQRLKARGNLVLLSSGDLGVHGETTWSISKMYCRPIVGPCAQAVLNAGRAVVFQVVLKFSEAEAQEKEQRAR